MIYDVDHILYPMIGLLIIINIKNFNLTLRFENIEYKEIYKSRVHEE